MPSSSHGEHKILNLSPIPSYQNVRVSCIGTSAVGETPGCLTRFSPVYMEAVSDATAGVLRCRSVSLSPFRRQYLGAITCSPVMAPAAPCLASINYRVQGNISIMFAHSLQRGFLRKQSRVYGVRCEVRDPELPHSACSTLPKPRCVQLLRHQRSFKSLKCIEVSFCKHDGLHHWLLLIHLTIS